MGRQGSNCTNCGERLTAKYHRWYPYLIRIEPLEKTRSKAMYLQYKPLFERFGITWHNEKQFEFVMNHYMLIKIYCSSKNVDIAPLYLERTYMIGVFAGRAFNTATMARKLLRDGSKLAMFSADFPESQFLRDQRTKIAEQMNLTLFQGINKCYFHAHRTNIEGWYDPSTISREHIIEIFKGLCYSILSKQSNHGNKNQTICTKPSNMYKTYQISTVPPLSQQNMVNNQNLNHLAMNNMNHIYNNLQIPVQMVGNTTNAPILLNVPSISPRNFNQNIFVTPSPTTNWLRVPPVFTATSPTNHIMAALQECHSKINT